MMKNGIRTAWILAGVIAGSCLFVASANAVAADASAPYKVVDGNKVDPDTMQGFRTWRAAACDRCHGPNQEGMVGPSLINSLKVLTKDEFVATVTKGRLEKGMPSFGENKTVTEHIDQLYAYLKGRSDGAITSSRVQEIK
jgi:mono/diheme cytochrome c family protein